MKTIFDKNLRRPNLIFVKKIKKIFFYYVRPKDKKILYVYSSKDNNSVKKINLTFFDSLLIKLDKFNLFGEINVDGTKFFLRNYDGLIIKIINLSKIKKNIESIFFNEKDNTILILDSKYKQLIKIHLNNLSLIKIKYKKFLIKNLDFNNAKFCSINSNKFIFCNYDKVFFLNKKLKIIKKLNKKEKDGPYSFRNITSIKICKDKIIICDQRNYKLKFYNLNFVHQKSIGKKGNQLGAFDLPTSIDVCDNKLFIADTNNDRILVQRGKTLKELIKPKFDVKLLRRPIKIISYGKSIIALDRDNSRIIFLSKNLKIHKSIMIKKFANGKPNSFDIFHDKKKIFLVILYRFSNLKNKIFIHDLKGKILNQIKINLKDAQDLSIFDNNIAIANTNDRSLIIYNLNDKNSIKRNLTKFTNNKKLLNKTVCWDEYGNIYTADFDKCIILKFDINLNFLKKITFKKIYNQLKVIRGIKIYMNNLFILNRGEYPLIVYDLAKNEISKKFGLYKKLRFNNPTSLTFYKNYLYLTDKENDRLAKLKFQN